MKTKSFDALDMKRRGQEALRAELEGMTPEQQLEFWKQKNQELREWQKQLRARPHEGDGAGA